MRESIHIVGGGIAGLSAGCYAQMNGYRSQIFEMNSASGGLCTAWQRNGYTIDGGVHWLPGSSPNSRLYHLWREVGAVRDQSFFNHDELIRIEGSSGAALTIYADIDRLAAHLLELAPEDRDLLAEWIRGLRRFARMEFPIEDPTASAGVAGRLGVTLKSLPHLSVFRRWATTTVRQFAEDLDNPFLREALPLAFDLPDFPMSTMMVTLAWMHNRTSGYPLGGSRSIAQAIEQRYLDLGGTIHYNAHVESILVEENRAVGILLADGTEHRADLVISAADGHTTIFDLLGGRYCDKTIHTLYNQLPLFPPLLLIGIGVNRDFDSFPHTALGISYPLDEPITVDGRELSRITVQANGFDHSLAPPGKTILNVAIPSNFERWRKLHEDPIAYRAEKDAVAAEVLQGLSHRFPGLSDDVEMVDVATPMTWHRRTGNWQGSYEGWLPSPKSLALRIPATLPGLYGFHMAGQWVRPGGGLPSAVISARHAVQTICKNDRKRFKASPP